MAKVLIVDDHPDSCRPVAWFLEREGHEVSCAVNGRLALADIIQSTPDLLIMDVMMPEMDGARLLEAVRHSLRLKALPVIVMTGLPDSPLVDRIRAAGASSILIKGKAGLDEIAAAVNEALGRPTN